MTRLRCGCLWDNIPLMSPPPSPSGASRTDLVLDTALALLRPLIRWMLRHGVSYTAFAFALKRVFLAAARDELRARGMPATDSALSLLSGVHRRDVRELSRGEAASTSPMAAAGGLPAEVVARWLSDPDFVDARRRPKALPRGEVVDGFDALVARISSDVRPRAVLDELVRLGVARLDPRSGRVSLVTTGFAPRQGFPEMAGLMRDNLHDHLSAACANLEDDSNFLEQSVFVDQITEESAYRLHVLAARLWRGVFARMMRAANERYEHDRSCEPRHGARLAPASVCTTSPPQRPRTMTEPRNGLPILALAIALALTACGPGTGGTGTGPTGAGVDAPFDAGTAATPLLYGDWRAEGIDLRLESARIEVRHGCQTVIYEGPWALDGSGAASVSARAADSSLATGTVSAGVIELLWRDGQLSVSLRDASGLRLVGPQTLGRSLSLSSPTPPC